MNKIQQRYDPRFSIIPEKKCNYKPSPLLARIYTPVNLLCPETVNMNNLKPSGSIASSIGYNSKFKCSTSRLSVGEMYFPKNKSLDITKISFPMNCIKKKKSFISQFSADQHTDSLQIHNDSVEESSAEYITVSKQMKLFQRK